mmetsp:Transcript_21416/g.69164  ORF Transcript_21416/g.69164 Transcript_21416/m.69164 type:complete len:472 (-) Transcript_21416:2673-4088(-)
MATPLLRIFVALLLLVIASDDALGAEPVDRGNRVVRVVLDAARVPVVEAIFLDDGHVRFCQPREAVGDRVRGVAVDGQVAHQRAPVPRRVAVPEIDPRRVAQLGALGLDLLLCCVFIVYGAGGPPRLLEALRAPARAAPARVVLDVAGVGAARVPLRGVAAVPAVVAPLLLEARRRVDGEFLELAARVVLRGARVARAAIAARVFAVHPDLVLADPDDLLDPDEAPPLELAVAALAAVDRRAPRRAVGLAARLVAEAVAVGEPRRRRRADLLAALLRDDVARAAAPLRPRGRDPDAVGLLAGLAVLALAPRVLLALVEGRARERPALGRIGTERARSLVGVVRVLVEVAAVVRAQRSVVRPVAERGAAVVVLAVLLAAGVVRHLDLHILVGAVPADRTSKVGDAITFIIENPPLLHLLARHLGEEDRLFALVFAFEEDRAFAIVFAFEIALVVGFLVREQPQVVIANPLER